MSQHKTQALNNIALPIEPILRVEGLTISIQKTDEKKENVDVVKEVSFRIYPNETVALVGESGCGKSLTAQAIMGQFTSGEPQITNGILNFGQQNLLNLSERERNLIRGKEITFIPQNPLNGLNPTLPIGFQLTEALFRHNSISREVAKERACDMLTRVGISDSRARLNCYPHELSGGMRQRVLIACALINHPKLVIADEPTTALDVTIQAQILDLLDDLQGQFGTSLLFITHDMGTVARLADRVVIMYAGKLVETGSVSDIFYAPKHPYTQALLACVPRLDKPNPEKLFALKGSPALPGSVKGRCPFAVRCERAMKVCIQNEPKMTPLSISHNVCCWHFDQKYAANAQLDQKKDT